MPKRRRFKQTTSLKDRLTAWAETHAPRISGIWPPRFAAMAALNKKEYNANANNQVDPPHVVGASYYSSRVTERGRRT